MVIRGKCRTASLFYHELADAARAAPHRLLLQESAAAAPYEAPLRADHHLRPHLSSHEH